MYFRIAQYIFAILCVFVVIYSFQYVDTQNKKYASATAGAEKSSPSHTLMAGSFLFKTENKQHTHEENTKKHQRDKCKHLHKPSESEIHFRHAYWQAQQDGQEDIVVYSAFYDDRPIVGRIPCIRLLGIRRLSIKPIWCYVWYSGKESPVVTKAGIVKTGRNQQIPDRYSYSQNMFTCSLDSADSVPTHVSIATRLCAVSSIYLPVTIPKKSNEWSHNFGACLDVSIGNFPPELIVEWMETYSMFGVAKVHVYNESLDGKMDRVFDHYRKVGFVDLRQMPPAVKYNGMKEARLGNPTSLNDCMLRNMYSHRYIVIADFDEIVVPRLHRTYQDMVDHLDSLFSRLPNLYHTYSFRNAYFFQHFPEDNSQPDFLRILRLRYRSKTSGYHFRTKSFIDPRRCKSVFSHYCLVRIDHKDFQAIEVNMSLALSHQYRSKCPFSSTRCEQYDKEKIQDSIMLKYRDVLIGRVTAALRAIGVRSK